MRESAGTDRYQMPQGQNSHTTRRAARCTIPSSFGLENLKDYRAIREKEKERDKKEERDATSHRRDEIAPLVSLFLSLHVTKQ